MNNETFNILFITHVTTLAGANRSMVQLITELVQEKHVYVTVMGPEDMDGSLGIKGFLSKMGILYIEAPVWFFKGQTITWSSFRCYIKYLFRNRNFYKSLKKYHFDIIHSNSSVIDIGGYLSRQLDCKHVWHFREFGDIDYSLYPVGGRLYEWITYKNSDAIIAISQSIYKHYSSKVTSSKFHLIYNGVKDVEESFSSLHESEDTQFLCAGIICNAKNQKEVVNAVNILVNQWHVKSLHVTFVGREVEPYSSELKAMIASYNLSSFMTTLPETDGIQNIAQTMDVGIVPSQAEAFGRVTIEYQLQNLLVIANDSGANPELIHDGETGLIYKSNDFSQLASKMMFAINRKPDMLRISRQGKLFAREHFLSHYNTEKIYNLYQTLLHN